MIVRLINKTFQLSLPPPWADSGAYPPTPYPRLFYMNMWRARERERRKGERGDSPPPAPCPHIWASRGSTRGLTMNVGPGTREGLVRPDPGPTGGRVSYAPPG